MGEQISGADMAGSEECLRVVLAEIGAGQLPADLDHAAYLRGAADTLSMLTGGSPDTKETGHNRDAGSGETFPQDK